MKIVWVSVHDVAPQYKGELDVIRSDLDSLGIHSRTLLVVPDFNRSGNLSAFPEFVSGLQEEFRLGHELALHGLHHDYAEFGRMSKAAAKKALSQGMDIFKSAFGFFPRGFVAPQWVQSRGSLEAVSEAGFEYTETLFSFRFRRGETQVIRTFPLNYDWGTSWIDALFLKLNHRRCRMANNGYLRFAIHPMDVRNKLWKQELSDLEMLLTHGWTATGYENDLKRLAGSVR